MFTIQRLQSVSTDDAEAIARLSGQWGYPVAPGDAFRRLRALLADGSTGFVVARTDEGSIAGWLMYRRLRHFAYDDSLEVTGIVVDESSRRLGMGKALLEEAEKSARRQGIRRVVLHCNTKRTGAHEFYPRNGYTAAKTQTYFVKEL